MLLTHPFMLRSCPRSTLRPLHATAPPHQVSELSKKYPGGLPQLDPLEDMAIVDPDLEAAVGRVQAMERLLAKNPGACRLSHSQVQALALPGAGSHTPTCMYRACI